MVRAVVILSIAVHSWCSLFCAGDVAACTVAPVCPCCPVEKPDDSSCCCEKPKPDPEAPKPISCCLVSAEPIGMPPKAPRLAAPTVLALLDAAAAFERRDSLTPLDSRETPPWLTNRGARLTHALLCVWIN